MVVKQVCVFLENTPGKLAEFTKMLGDKGINLISISIADTSSFGILRAIVSNPVETLKIIEQAGYTARITQVLAAKVPNRPGSLAEVLDILAKSGISVEYLYSFKRNLTEDALIIISTSQLYEAVQTLESNAVKLLGHEEVVQF